MPYEMYYKKSITCMEKFERDIIVVANEYGVNKEALEKCYYTMLPIICNNYHTYDIPVFFEEKSELEMLIEGLERYLGTYKFSAKKYASLYENGKEALLAMEMLSNENTLSIFFRLAKLMIEDLRTNFSYFSMDFHKEVGKKIKAKDILSIENAVHCVFDDRKYSAECFFNK